MKALPATATVTVAEDVADAMYRAMSALPARGDKELGSPRLQRQLREDVRASAPAVCDALARALRERVAQPPYAAYVTGLRFDEHDLLLVALSSVLGDVVDAYDRMWSRVVRRLSPRRDRVVPGVGVLSEDLHTDGTDFPDTNAVMCLQCVRPDENGGGRTRLLDFYTVIGSVLPAFDAACVDVLTSEPVPWQIAEACGGGTVAAPVVAERRLRWLRHGIASPLPARVDHAMGASEDALAAATSVIESPMAAGAVLLLNNKLTLHARTSIPDPAGSQRLVLRTRMCRRPDSDATD